MQMYENFIKVNFDDLEIGDVFLKYYENKLKWCVKSSGSQIIDNGDIIGFNRWSECYLTMSQYVAFNQKRNSKQIKEKDESETSN